MFQVLLSLQGTDGRTDRRKKTDIYVSAMTLTTLSEDFCGLYQEVRRRQEDNLALGHGRPKCNPQVY